MKRILFLLFPVVLLLMACPAEAPVAADRAAVEGLLSSLGAAMTHRSAGDIEAAGLDLQQFRSRWQTTGLEGDRAGRAVDRALRGAETTLARGDAEALEARLSDLLEATTALLPPAAEPADRAAALALLPLIDGVLEQVRSERWDEAGEGIRALALAWETLEDEVRDADAAAYGEIEVQQTLARTAVRPEEPDPGTAETSLQTLRALVDDYAAGRAARAGATTTATLAEYVRLARSELEALERGDIDAAAALAREGARLWPAVEGEVRTSSVRAYELVEEDLLESAGLVLTRPEDLRRAVDIATARIRTLEPLDRDRRYGAWDAGLILFREGLEALLAVGALLALLKKTGQSARGRWVWLGVGGGLVVSAVAGVILGVATAGAVSGAAREGVEGFVGLLAVALMLTVGAWLHGKSRIKTWTDFIKGKAGKALAAGSSWSLAFVAFLAITREGVETVVFYLGIAPSIGGLDLVLGVVGAALALVVIGFLLIRFSVRLPLRPMFLAATLIIYYLAFKILGESVHALQVAGLFPAHTSAWLPTVPLVGMYATWETFLPQLALALFVAAELYFTERKQRAASAAAGAAAAGSKQA